MLSSTLDAALTAKQRRIGLRLYEPDDHILELRYQGELVACFSQPSVTVAEIRATAERIAKHQKD